ncbi:MAG: lytic transglycosylase domain-containing protein [Bdellovibrio sp.]|nr:lytic transglycosylase domain-containing protein [Bdellovibrio sp.]
MKTIISFFMICNYITVYVFAAADHPIAWKDMEDLDLRDILRSQYLSSANLYYTQHSINDFHKALYDTEAKTNKEFTMPEPLLHAVEFWLKIYTQYSTQQVIIFDKRHPDLIYEVSDFRDLYQTSKTLAAYEITLDRVVNRKLNHYKQTFQSLIYKKMNKIKKYTQAEQAVLATIKNSYHKHNLFEFSKNIKTQIGQRDNVIKGLLAAELFFPKMEQIFRSQNLNEDLVRLSLVESSFNLKAVSSADAVGVWQFLKRSGAEYLRIDPTYNIDERLSPLKSTLAAAKLLKRNYKLLKNWPLTITSYHHGLKNLRPFIKRTTASRSTEKIIFDLCRSNSPLGWASQNYYAEFLALLRAEKYKHLFYGVVPTIKNSNHFFFHQLTKKTSAVDIAYKSGISLQEFHLLNPDVKKLQTKLPKGFWVAIFDPQIDNLDFFTKNHSVRLTQFRRSQNVNNTGRTQHKL